MESIDLITMLGNLSQSLPAVDEFLGGFSYIFGLIFCIISLIKLKDNIGEGDGSSESLFIPLAYFSVGVGLLFLPSLYSAFSQTLFGTTDNVLAYSSTNKYDVYNSMTMLIQTAGFIWFIRGCVLLAHSSKPEQGREGSKGLGPKGFFFMLGGLFAINIYSTVDMLDYTIYHIMKIFSGMEA